MFIDDNHLIILNDIIDILFKYTVGFDQLVDGMNAFVAQGIVFLNFAALFHQLFRRKVIFSVQFSHHGNHVRQDIHVRIVGVEFFAAFFGQTGIVPFFVDREEELLTELAGLRSRSLS